MRRAVLALFLLLPVSVSATALDTVITATPKNPEPGARVELTASPRGYDPTLARFTWLVDDEEVASGIGRTTASLVAPALGEASVVRVIVNDEERASPLTIRPTRVTIEWEGIAERPPLYVGRPLFSGQGFVRAVAVPELVSSNGVPIPGNQIRYTWSQNGNRIRGPEFGASSIVVEPIFYNRPFSLTVEATGGGLTAAHTVVLQAADPDIVVYEQSPLLGLLDHRAVEGTYDFAASEVSFIAHALHTTSGLTYRWSLNGEPIIIAEGDPRVAVFKKTGAGAGAYTVGIEVGNPSSFLEEVRRAFLLQF